MPAWRREVVQSRGVRQQIPHGYRARRRNQDLSPLRFFLEHPLAFELGQMLLHRIVHREFALILQHQDRHGGHRLGHGSNPEEVIGPQGRAGAQVGVSRAIDTLDAILARHYGDRARHGPVLHKILQDLLDGGA